MKAVKGFQVAIIKLAYGTDEKDLVDALSNLFYAIDALPDADLESLEVRLGVGFFDTLKTKMRIQQELWGLAGKPAISIYLDKEMFFAPWRLYRTHVLAGELDPGLYFHGDDDEYWPEVNHAEEPIRGSISLLKQLSEKKLDPSSGLYGGQRLADYGISSVEKLFERCCFLGSMRTIRSFCMYQAVPTCSWPLRKMLKF